MRYVSASTQADLTLSPRRVFLYHHNTDYTSPEGICIECIEITFL